MNKTQKDLWCDAYGMFLNRTYDKAEKMLLMALNAEDDNVIDRHFTYNILIKLYYKLRNERKDALEKCIKYCKEDIERLPEFLKAYKMEYGDVPQCPSTIQLTIIYEKSGEFQKAIDLCNFALNLGLKDGTKQGFQGRKAKLGKKLKK